ncbi:site-specific DNA-methyltransferase [Staphylococcus pseudintermedius]|uniref:DNA-methyltransferase n=1 Tax=Staphylococcus pseudintermedius TaxID=283734 RepID=UPI00286D9A3D|nr:site-specific DNA-methyltransferase [Staphylococcus pseudintermedius]WMZ75471.1 site-specific DNA-methyltransferase [Staphylococcus pseudintermedius]
MIELNKIYNEDCLEGMKRIPDKSVDMILCDLPYGTTACKWDEIIPLEPLWEQYERVIKNDGAIVLTASQPFTSNLVMSNPKLFREEVIWLKNKGASGLQAKQKHIKVHESILVYSKKGKYTYNPIKWEVEEKQFLTQRKTMSMYGETNNIYGSLKRKRKADDGTRNPISVIPFKVPITGAKTKKYTKEVDLRIHPTQKPVALFEYLIKTYSNEGETVLDNCMGSGTTAVACLNTKRNYIGFELDEEYYEVALKRIELARELKQNEQK